MRQSFRIYRHPQTQSWRWECSLCWPPARGARFGPDAWLKILRISLPHHMRVRDCHHQHVARSQPSSR